MGQGSDYITHHDLAMWEAWPSWAKDRWKNFSPWEFRSGTSKEFLYSCRLLDALQELRDKAGVPLYVNQPEHGLTRRGFRTPADNTQAGGVFNSQHLAGRAADVDARGAMTPFQLAQIAKTIPAFAQGGIIIYRTFVHLDDRPDGPYHGTK